MVWYIMAIEFLENPSEERRRKEGKPRIEYKVTETWLKKSLTYKFVWLECVFIRNTKYLDFFC